MRKSRVSSPARSVGDPKTPKQYQTRHSQSLTTSPGRSSGRLTSLVDQFKQNNRESLPFSPLSKTILNDNTDIEQPRRTSWWKQLNNSRDVVEVLDGNKPEVVNNILEEFDVEVLSQSQKNDHTVDLPESSDNESIRSIVVPQRKLFTQKENVPQQKYKQVSGTRETLAKQNKTTTDNEINDKTGTKSLFGHGVKRTKPIFPAALLNISPDKTIGNKTKELVAEVKAQPRSLFGNRPDAKRKNVFADFIVSESEDEIPDIEPKRFTFSKRPEPIRRVSSASRGTMEPSPTMSVTTDIEMDDWKMLPSSTMVDYQLEAIVGTTPGKKARLSKLSEAKESEAGTGITDIKSDKSKSSTQEKVVNEFNDDEEELNLTYDDNEQEQIDVNDEIDEHNGQTNKKTEPALSDKEASLNKNECAIENNMMEKENEQTHKEINDEVDEEIHEMSVADNENERIENKVVEDSNTPEIQSDNDNELHQDDNVESKHENAVSENENEESKISNEVSHVEEQEVAPTEIEEDDGQSVAESEAENDEQESNAEIEGDEKSVAESEAENDEQESNAEIEGDEKSVAESEAENDEQESNAESEAENEENDAILVNNESGDEENEENEVEDEVEENQMDDEVVENQVDYESENHEDIDNEEADADNPDESAIIENNEQSVIESDHENNDEDLQANNTQEEVVDESQEQIEEEDIEESDEVDQEESEEQINESLVQELDDENLGDDQEGQESDEDEENKVESHDEIENTEENQESKHENNIEPAIESPNESHDTTGRHRNRNRTKSPEAILHEISNQADSFIVKGRNTSIKKKSILKNFSVRQSMAPPRESTGLSDGTRNSSAEGSGWDSHRTTRKTLRQTFGRDFSPRKSLRALVMEKSAKRQTQIDAANAELREPQANSTELQENLPPHSEMDFEDDVEMAESDHEISKRTRQTTLEMYLQKIQKDNMERNLKIVEQVRNSFKPAALRSDFLNRVAYNPQILRANTKSLQKPVAKKRPKPCMFPLGDLPPELVDDMKYKPPKRFRPSNAPWITKRLYKFLETKLEPKYDYKARVRAEKLVETIYHFAKDARRYRTAQPNSVIELKKEMARLNVVNTHYDFYNFFRDYMPVEVKVKVVPDIVNEIPLPREGLFSNIISGQ